MTISELRAKLVELEAAGRGGDQVYTCDGDDFAPLQAAGVYLHGEGLPVLVLDLTAGDEE